MCTASYVAPATSGTVTLRARREGLDLAGSPAALSVATLTVGQVSAGGGQTCGVLSSGEAYCWGLNDRGQLGAGYTVYLGATAIASPTKVIGGRVFATITSGSSHACALTLSGAAFCWGDNSFGALGDGTSYNYRDFPVGVTAAPTFTALSTGVAYTCGLASDGAAWCWGWGVHCQLGDQACVSRERPALVAGGLRFKQLAAGAFHTCGLTEAGVAYCWGRNASGEIGDGSITTSTLDARRFVPAPVSGGLTFTELTAGGGFMENPTAEPAHTCALTTDGVAYCWGANESGQLGDGTTTTRLVPTAVAGGVRFSRLTAGGQFTCGLTGAGSAYCWGRNEWGQLADLTTTTRLQPTPVQSPVDPVVFTALDAGRKHVCGMTAIGAYCWGSNAYGQLGGGGTIDAGNYATRPAQVLSPF
jgi:alpha-tubulin suppressor-like RCC1 family protein